MLATRPARVSAGDPDKRAKEDQHLLLYAAQGARVCDVAHQR